MSEIPEDVRMAARKQCDLAGVTQHSDARDYCEYVAAFSIMAERERCAKVCDDANEEWGDDAERWLDDDMPKTAKVSREHACAARKLATAIRKGATS